MFWRLITYRAVMALRHTADDLLPVLLFLVTGLGWLAVTQGDTVAAARPDGAPLASMADLLPPGGDSVCLAAVVLMTLLRIGTHLDMESPFSVVVQKVFLAAAALAAGLWAVHQLSVGTWVRYGPLSAAVLLALWVRRIRRRDALAILRRRTAAGFAPSPRAFLGLRTFVALQNVMTAYPQTPLFTTNLVEAEARESAAVFRQRGDSTSEAFCWAVGIEFMISHNDLPQAERLLRELQASPEAAGQPAALAAEAALLRAVGEPEEALALMLRASSFGRPPAALRGLVAEVALEAGAIDTATVDGVWRRTALVWRHQYATVLLGLVVEARHLAGTAPDRALTLVYRLCRLLERLAPLTTHSGSDMSLDAYHRARTATGLALMLAAETYEAQGHPGAAAGAYLDALEAFTASKDRTRAARCIVLGFLNGITAGYNDPDQEEHALDMIRVGLQILEEDRGALRGEQHRATWLKAQQALYERVFAYAAEAPHAHSAKAAELGLWLLESLHRTLTEALIDARGGSWHPGDAEHLARLTRLETAARARTAEEFEAMQKRLSAQGGRAPFLDRLAAARRGDDTSSPREARTVIDPTDGPPVISGTTDVRALLDRLGDRVALLYHCRHDERGWLVQCALVSRRNGTRLHRSRLDRSSHGEEIAAHLTVTGALDAFAAADEQQTAILFYTPLDDPVWADLSAALIPAEWWDLLCPIGGDPAREVIVVPDGPLSALPFAALPVRGGRPLLEYALVTLTPALSMLRPPGRTTQSAGRTVVSHIGADLDARVMLAEAGALEGITASATVRRTSDRAQLVAALRARPRPDIAIISAHGSSGGSADRSLLLADGSALSAASASMLPWPDTVVLGSCWVNGMIVNAGEEPFGFPLACFLGGAETVVGGAAPVQDDLTSADLRRLIASVPHRTAPLRVLRDAALTRVRGRSLSELDAATLAGLISWSTAAPMPCRSTSRSFWNKKGLAEEQGVSQGVLSLTPSQSVRAVLEAATSACDGPVDTRGFAVAAFAHDTDHWAPPPGPPGPDACDEPPLQGSGQVLLRPASDGPAILITAALARALRRSARLAGGAHQATSAHVITAAVLDDESGLGRWVHSCGLRGEQWADHHCLRPLGGRPAPETLLGLTPGDWERHSTRMATAEEQPTGTQDAYNWGVALVVGLLIAGVPALLGAPSTATTPSKVTVTFGLTDITRAAGLDQAMAKLRSRAEQSGITGARFGRSGDTITVTAPVAAREQLEALAEGVPGAQLRPVLALRPDGPQSEPQLGQTSPSPRASASASGATAPQLGAEPVSPGVEARFAALHCSGDADSGPDPGTAQPAPAQQAVLCDAHEPIAYLLGTAALVGTDVSNAKASRLQGQGWGVTVSFTSAGRTKLTQVTSRLATLQTPQNQLAITAADRVVSAPMVRETLSGNSMEISGVFSEKQAEELARTLVGQPAYRVLDVSVE
ncbi:CHAT domain-containing protein [Streptomyces sp. NPDC002764]|uniref:SecDF P1 head subdomain-containing protein n=1 Tax=Streptomyces sp. NPDC002764 TaxID=3154428 RepID=UPI00331D5C5A